MKFDKIDENVSSYKWGQGIYLVSIVSSFVSSGPMGFPNKKRLKVSGIPRESGRGRDLDCGSGIGTG